MSLSVGQDDEQASGPADEGGATGTAMSSPPQTLEHPSAAGSESAPPAAPAREADAPVSPSVGILSYTPSSPATSSSHSLNVSSASYQPSRSSSASGLGVSSASYEPSDADCGVRLSALSSPATSAVSSPRGPPNPPPTRKELDGGVSESTRPPPPGGDCLRRLMHDRNPLRWMATFPPSCAYWAAQTELAIAGRRTMKLGLRHPEAGVVLVSHLLLGERAAEEAQREVQRGLEGRLGGEAASPGPVFFERLCEIEESAYLAFRSRYADFRDQYRRDAVRDVVEAFPWVQKPREAAAPCREPILPSETSVAHLLQRASLLARCGVCPPCRAPPQCATLKTMPCWRETMSRAVDFGFQFTPGRVRYRAEQLQSRMVSYVSQAEAMAPCVRGLGQGLHPVPTRRQTGAKRQPWMLVHKLAEGGALDPAFFFSPVLRPYTAEGDAMPEAQVWIQVPERRPCDTEFESAAFPLTWMETRADWRRAHVAMVDLGLAWGGFGLPALPTEPDDLQGPVRWDASLSLVEVLGYVPHRRLLDSLARQPSTRRWVAELKGWPGSPAWTSSPSRRCRYCGTAHIIHWMVSSGNCPLHRLAWGGRQLPVEDVQLYEATVGKPRMGRPAIKREREAKETVAFAVYLPSDAQTPPPPQQNTILVAASYLRGGKRFLFEFRGWDVPWLEDRGERGRKRAKNRGQRASAGSRGPGSSGQRLASSAGMDGFWNGRPASVSDLGEPSTSRADSPAGMDVYLSQILKPLISPDPSAIPRVSPGPPPSLIPGPSGPPSRRARLTPDSLRVMEALEDLAGAGANLHGRTDLRHRLSPAAALAATLLVGETLREDLDGSGARPAELVPLRRLYRVPPASPCGSPRAPAPLQRRHPRRQMEMQAGEGSEDEDFSVDDEASSQGDPSERPGAQGGGEGPPEPRSDGARPRLARHMPGRGGARMTAADLDRIINAYGNPEMLRQVVQTLEGGQAQARGGREPGQAQARGGRERGQAQASGGGVQPAARALARLQLGGSPDVPGLVGPRFGQEGPEGHAGEEGEGPRETEEVQGKSTETGCAAGAGVDEDMGMSEDWRESAEGAAGHLPSSRMEDGGDEMEVAGELDESAVPRAASCDSFLDSVAPDISMPSSPYASDDEDEDE